MAAAARIKERCEASKLLKNPYHTARLTRGLSEAEDPGLATRFVRMEGRMTSLVCELFEGAIDIIGDVHGEIEALEQLLEILGYDPAGRHRAGRRLVFVGDLVDRGPDSPAVLERVMALVSSARAQCVLGNHELNLLRSAERPGNAWYLNPRGEASGPSRRVEPHEKPAIHRFLSSLPLALAREDLRVVHACWHAPSVLELRRHTASRSAAELHDEYAREASRQAEETGLLMRFMAEATEHGQCIGDRSWSKPVLLPAMAELDASYQMRNPVRVLSSGEEAPTSAPFWAGRKWRMVERVKWWDEYDEDIPIVVGHYWRRSSASQRSSDNGHGPGLFGELSLHEWAGKRRNVYCVDFSVGGRPTERLAGTAPPLTSRLAALRVPEWQLVQDDGKTWQLNAPG